MKKFLWLKKLKNTVPWANAISDLNSEELRKKIEKQIKESRI